MFKKVKKRNNQKTNIGLDEPSPVIRPVVYAQPDNEE